MRASHDKPIQQIGILLASTAAAHNAPSPEQADAARQSLRGCWSDLQQLAMQAQEDDQVGEQARNRLQVDHRAALDALVEAGQLDAAAADRVQSIYEEAAYHAWRSSIPITCYLVGPPYYLPPRLDAAMLALQADSLQEIGSNGDVDRETISRARAAIEQEMTRLGKLETEVPPGMAGATRFLSGLLLED